MKIDVRKSCLLYFESIISRGTPTILSRKYYNIFVKNDDSES